jgi:hypothetical protein
METTYSFEMWVDVQRTEARYIPQDRILHSQIDVFSEFPVVADAAAGGSICFPPLSSVPVAAGVACLDAVQLVVLFSFAVLSHGCGLGHAG